MKQDSVWKEWTNESLLSKQKPDKNKRLQFFYHLGKLPKIMLRERYNISTKNDPQRRT